VHSPGPGGVGCLADKRAALPKGVVVTEVSGTQYIDEGIQAAIERAEEYGLDASFELLAFTREALVSVIGDWPDELHERFIVLFAENVTVAAIARDRLEHGRIARRIEYQENRGEESRDPFEEGELLAFLAHSTAFFNSFKHRHGDRRS
jgi:hypothetical protein